MTTSAIIGCDSPLGKYWSGKRFFDYLINEENYSLLRGRTFGQVVLICPSLWQNPEISRSDVTSFIKKVTSLIGILGETKIERLTYVTTLDLITDDGDESNRVTPEEETSWQGALAGLYDYVNLHFGRMVNLHLPELVGLEDNGPGWSVIAELAAASKTGRKPKTGLLTKHQFYPLHRIVNDAETAWECGLNAINLASEPITTFELTERLFPKLVDFLPTAKEKDPIGSARTSLYSIYYNDTIAHFIMDKESLLEELTPLR